MMRSNFRSEISLVHPTIRRENRLREWLLAKGFSDMWNPSVRGTDWALLLVVVALLAIGLLMVYSASMSEGYARYGMLGYWFKRQLKWAGIGIPIMLLCWRIRYTFWRYWSVELMLLALLLLLAVLIVGQPIFGSVRHLLEGSIQPSEFAKLAVVIYMAAWMSSKGEKLREVGFGLVPFVVLVSVIAGLVVAQPNRSTAILIIVTAISMFFVAGADLKQFGLGILLGGATIALVILAADYARERVTEFFAVWRNPLEGGELQLQQFILCLRAGGFWGKGPGNGTVNDAMILAHSDSIFAVIGEEGGLFGCLMVLGLFVGLAYRGIRIARQAPDAFGLIMAFGITVWLVLQAFINIGVVTATIPTTGVPLTFISYGGSALVTALAGTGILLSISCSKAQGEEGEDARVGVRGRQWGPRLPRAGSH